LPAAAYVAWPWRQPWPARPGFAGVRGLPALAVQPRPIGGSL